MAIADSLFRRTAPAASLVEPTSIPDAGDAELLGYVARIDAIVAPALEAARRLDAAREDAGWRRGLNPLGWAREVTAPAAPRWPADTALGRLRDRHALGDVELDVLLLAASPEIDRRYERVIAALHDEPSERWPTVGLLLALACADPLERLRCRDLLEAEATLVRERLVHRAGGAPDSAALARAIRCDDGVVRALLGLPGLDPRLSPVARCEFAACSLDDLDLDPADLGRLRALVAVAGEGGRVAPVVCAAEPRPDAVLVGHALAEALGRDALVVDVAAAVDGGWSADELVPIAAREAERAGLLLILERVDEAPADRPAALRGLAARCAELPEPVVVCGRPPADGEAPAAALVVELAPSVVRRANRWRRHLATHGLPAPADLDGIAHRLQLSERQIAAGAAEVAAIARLEGDGPAWRGVGRMARRLADAQLEGLATRVEAAGSWDDLVLPPSSTAQLQDMVQRLRSGPRVLRDWGFAEKGLGPGVTALFFGPSGTGKTMAAGIIAAELGLDLFRIDLAATVSKYIGETEKNLARVFRAARSSNAMLFFDEAEALFGRRSEIRDAHDRYANIEVAYLLQSMERHEGGAILATNLRRSLDDALARRLTFSVSFPFPEAESRRRLWRGVWPERTPLAPDVDLDGLADALHLSGGNIANVAAAAAYLAAAEDAPVGRAHLLRAVRAEFLKMGVAAPDLAAVASPGEAAAA